MNESVPQCYDVVIVGAGLAGLQCAKLLAERGASVLLVDWKADLTQGIHTTGIFVRKTLEDFEFPPDSVGSAVRDVVLYSPQQRSLRLSSAKDEFRVGRMGLLYEWYLADCVARGVIFSPSTRYVSSNEVYFDEPEGTKPTPSTARTRVHFERNGEAHFMIAQVLIGADGANSRVAKDLGLDENREFIVGAEEVWSDVPLVGPPILHCFLDAQLAPGYLAWVTNDGDEVHIGVGGYQKQFNPREALAAFKQKVARQIVDLSEATLVERRGGRIPVGGVLKRIASVRGLLIGDAAGAVSPLTAGGLDPCLRLSRFAAEVVAERLRTGEPDVLLSFSGELFRARFVSRLWMRRILGWLSNQFLLEVGCAMLRLPVIKKLAAHVFFGRGSFPDVKLKQLQLKDETMKDKVTSRATTIVPFLIALAILLMTYVGGYHALDKMEQKFIDNGAGHLFNYGYISFGMQDEPPWIWRAYDHDWQVTLFKPAAKLESCLRGIDIQSIHSERFGFDFDFNIDDSSPVADEGTNEGISEDTDERTIEDIDEGSNECNAPAP